MSSRGLGPHATLIRHDGWQLESVEPTRSALILHATAEVASISVRVHQGKRQVTVRGHLTAGDLRRLERACGPALEHRELLLELRVGDVENMDESCRLFLASLSKRGAVFT